MSVGVIFVFSSFAFGWRVGLAFIQHFGPMKEERVTSGKNSFVIILEKFIKVVCNFLVLVLFSFVNVILKMIKRWCRRH